MHHPPTPSLNKSKGANAPSAGIASEGRWADQKQSTFKAQQNVLLLPAGSGFQPWEQMHDPPTPSLKKSKGGGEKTLRLSFCFGEGTRAE